MSFSGWKDTSLGEIVNFRRGHDLPKSNMNPGIYPVVGSNGIIGYHDSYTTVEPCITIGRSGNVGNPHKINQKAWAHNTTLYIDDFKGNDPNFIFYLLKTLNLQHYKGGSAVPTLNRNHIHPIALRVPIDIQDQKAIAHILSTLDEKIEINNKINKILEDMAQAIFKHWFVDFEFPNDDGEPYKSSGGEMVDSELGPIPKGWEVGTLSDLGEVIGGGTPSTKREDYYTDNGISWITPKDLSVNKSLFIYKGAIDITEEGLKYSSSKLVPEGTILFSSRAPIGYIAVAGCEMATNQGFKSIVPQQKYGSAYVYQELKSKTDAIMNRASGSTFMEISGSGLKSIETILPTEAVTRKYQEITRPILNKIKYSEKEVNTLTTIRDTLLPKLMSGEIRVPIENEQ
jgi:type I restriction enzyme S subunit